MCSGDPHCGWEGTGSVAGAGRRGAGVGSWRQVLALLVALDTALGTAHALPRDAPQQPLTLVAIGGCGSRPHLEVVWRRARDGVD